MRHEIGRGRLAPPRRLHPRGRAGIPADDGTGTPLANELPPDTPAWLVIHFYNPGDEPVKTKIILDAESLAPGVAYTRSGTLLHVNGSISLPAQVVGDVETQTCGSLPAVKYWRLSIHAHRHAVHTEIREGASATPPPAPPPPVLFASDDWETPVRRPSGRPASSVSRAAR